MAIQVIDDLLSLLGSAAEPTVELRTAGGITLPTLGIGCWAFGSNPDDYWGERKLSDDFAVVQCALRNGFVYFDTAEAYNAGESERVLAKALNQLDEQKTAVVGSKVLPQNCFAPLLRQACLNSLERLGQDSMDLYMVHWPLNNISITSGDVPTVQEAFSTLRDLQNEGKITHIGVSNFGVQQLREALATGVKIAVNQVMYNMFSRAIEFEVLPFCRENDIAVIAYSPLMQGLLTDKSSKLEGLSENRCRTRHFDGSRPKSRHGGAGVEDDLKIALLKLKEVAKRESRSIESMALAWCIAQPGVTTVIAGARNVDQFQKNMRSVFDPLSPALKRELDEATNTIKQKLGPYIDYYQGNEQQRSF